MKVHNNKIICKFLFLHDLSGWHYSARKSFHDYWIRTPSKLTGKERTALVAWRKLNVSFYERKGDFMLSDYLSGTLHNGDKQAIFGIFKILEPRFEFHYRRQLPNMKKVAAYLQKYKDLRYLRETYKLYGLRNYSMPVYLAMSRNANRSAGGMQLGNAVILQFGDYKLKKGNSPMMNVMFHELTHKGGVRKYLPANLNIKLPRSFTENVKDFADEVVHKALWSEVGLFSQKQFGWSNRIVEKKYRFLLKKLRSPYKEMIANAFKVREYLAKELQVNPNFKFDHDSARKIVSVIGK